MAFISALFSLFSKKLGDLLQAIFGWSIAGLFGKLPSGKQTGLSVALILSILWPLLVVGCFFPALAAWAVAFVPLHEWLGDTVLRVVWIVLAVVAPVVVGALIAWVAPSEKQRGGIFRTVLSGFPLIIGLFLSFLLTLFIVPVLKVIAMAKRWDDDHVFVQPKEGAYLQVLAQLKAACEKAGIEVQDEPTPGFMRAPLRVLKWFARSSLDSIVVNDPRRLRGPGLELYLYPADLLIRGSTERARHVRAAMVRELFHAPAYLSQDGKAQHVEDEINRTWDIIKRHRSVDEVRDSVKARLVTIAKDLNEADIPYEDWVLLFTNLNRLELALYRGVPLADERPSAAGEELAMQGAMTGPVPGQAPGPAPGEDPLPEMSTVELVKEAIEESRALLKTEIALARDEATRDIAAVKRVAVTAVITLVTVIMGLSMLLVGAVLAIGVQPLPAFGIGAGLLVIAGHRGWNQL